jgi:hypothetical protein
MTFTEKVLATGAVALLWLGYTLLVVLIGDATESVALTVAVAVWAAWFPATITFGIVETAVAQGEIEAHTQAAERAVRQLESSVAGLSTDVGNLEAKVAQTKSRYADSTARRLR